jgi:hypothetical protein
LAESAIGENRKEKTEPPLLQEQGATSWTIEYKPVPSTRWSEFLHFFRLRIDRTPPSFLELVAGVQWLHQLQSQFNNLCVVPIFDRLPKDKRAAISEQRRGRLNCFQQRFTLYLRDCMAFAKELSQALSELEHLPYHLPYSNPL